jgi:hypothetical protein
VFIRFELAGEKITFLLTGDEMTEPLKKDHGSSSLHPNQLCGSSGCRARHEQFQQLPLDSDRHPALSGKDHSRNVFPSKLASLCS